MTVVLVPKTFGRTDISLPQSVRGAPSAGTWWCEDQLHPGVLPSAHMVSPLGFLLLEEVEQALGSAKQEVEGLGHLLGRPPRLCSQLKSVSSAGNDGEFEGGTKLSLQRQERC